MAGDTHFLMQNNMGARISGDPAALASALAKIDAAAHEIKNIPAEQNPATAHFIINLWRSIASWQT
ncbi:MAG: hypothetical protein ACM3IH_21075 [Sphingobacteriales bacterium]